MMRHIFMWLALSTTIMNKCNEGCLKCDITSKTCVFCDFVNKYYLTTNGCLQNDDQNCISIKENGQCDKCKEDYYLLKEVCVPVDKPIENCKTYNSDQSCRYCKQDFYLLNSNCVAVEIPIQNCIQYDETGQSCARCKPGTFLYIDKRYCLNLKIDTTCLSWSQLVCESCNDGYEFNQNTYIIRMLILFENRDSLKDYIYSYFNNDINYVPSKCLKKQVENCKLFLDFETCIVCDQGFMLLDNNCIDIDSNLGEYCIKRLSADTCSECLQGYFVRNGECVKVRELPNCIRYDNKVGNGNCIQCEDQYYLKSNTCIERKYSLYIEKCIEYSLIEDMCVKCEEGFILSGDGLACLTRIEKCNSYHESSVMSSQIFCKQCINKYRLDKLNNQCEIGQVENCLTYDDKGCYICENGYFLNDSGLCEAHDFLLTSVCGKWSNIVKNKCDECPINHIIVSQLNDCRILKNPIENCKTYNNIATECIECEAGYHLDNNVCILNTIENCEIENNALCSKCGTYTDEILNINFYYELADDQLSCKKPFTEHITNCTITESAYNGCAGCISYYYPTILPYNTRMCYPKNFHKLNPELNSAILNDCEVFDIKNEICLRCKNGMLLENNTCVSNCSSAFSVFLNSIERDLLLDKLYYYKENYCASPLVANCEIHDISLTVLNTDYGGDIKYGCVKCKTGYMPLIDLDKPERSLGHYHRNGVKEIGSAFAFIDECVLNTTVIDNPLTVNTDFNNCKYITKSNSMYGCLSCEHGYTGLANLAESIYFIESCTVFNDCDSSFYAKGLGANMAQLSNRTIFKYPLDMLVSCHSCNDLNKVVAFSISNGGSRVGTVGKLGSISQWLYTSNEPYTSNGSTQTICIEIDPSLNIPNNCASLTYVVENELKGYENGEADLTTGVLCTTCKPGYGAVFNFIGAVTSCTLISNCAEPIFNGCRACDEGYALNYNMLRKMIDYTACHEAFENCVAGYLGEENSFICAICDSGYILNADNKCDKISIPNCIEEGHIIPLYGQSILSNQREPIEYMLERKPVGCYRCDENYISAYDEAELNRFICVQNNYIKENGNTSSYFYVDNCNHSYFNTTYSSIRCKECVPPRVNINGKCVLNTVLETVIQSVGECEEFDYFAERCNLCKEGYFISGGKCFKGNMPFCKVYNTHSDCKECEEGYYSLYLSKTESSCLKLPDNYNCKSFNQDAAKRGELKCDECVNGYYKNFDPKVMMSSLCLEINAVINCKKYKPLHVIQYGHLECSECDDGYYLLLNNCIERDLIENCKTYTLDNNKCETCKDGYVLLADGYLCRTPDPYTFSYDLCVEYTEFDNCYRCKPGYYVVDGKCVEVPNESKIENCESYVSLHECDKCIQGYFNQKISCIKALATNCLTYDAIDRCKSCEQGYGLTDNGIRINCEEIKIPNCKIPDSSSKYPFRCLICEKDFYLDNDRNCEAVDHVIEFCEIYEADGICKQCEKNMALSENQQFCFVSPRILGSTDLNCRQSRLLDVPTCVTCAAGFYWQDGDCKSCSNLVPGLGCLICNPYDETKCLICAPDYYMNTQGDCVIANSDNFDPNSYSTTHLLSIPIFILILQEIL